ncbi:MAG: twin-arginine translocase TatA/TatE family subunit [bacterium]
MPNLGFPELLVILVLALLLFGAGRLPDVGRSLGKAISEFKRAVAGGDGPEEPRKSEPSEKPASRSRRKPR